jgi:gamma-glutamyltranspeptidase/glutathione hydrolase
VAVGFALAVTLPRAGNLGGGGFMLIHMAAAKATHALDYREMAPKAAHRDMYIGADGKVDKTKARFSHHSVGVPGTVAGLIAAQEKFGSLPLAALIAPAITLADDGVTVTPGLARALQRSAKRLKRWPATAAVFYKPDGDFYRNGERLVQKDLAGSLRLIAKNGAAAFYTGAIAKAIAAEMSGHGSAITLSDLAAYRPHWRAPVHGSYRGYDIASMPPPSSGGLHLVQMLNILAGYDLAKSGLGSARTSHLLAETMRLAYADRALHLGDPDFWQVPAKGLISRKYADLLRSRINPDKARPSAEVRAGKTGYFESE